MKYHDTMARLTAVAVVPLALLLGSTTAFAHCDTLDGPVVAAARKALDSGNVNLILVWVQKKDEGEIRNMFQKAVAVRKAGGQAKELADMYFFETSESIRLKTKALFVTMFSRLKYGDSHDEDQHAA